MSSNIKRVHYFHAEANSLGGFVDKPLQKLVPAQASSTLPAVGGHVTHNTEAFDFEGIVSCRSTYTRVSGRQVEQDGPPFTIVTSVVEGLNLSEVVTADRVVAQMSVEHPVDGGFPIVSFTGSHFEGLKIGGRDASPVLNPTLVEGGSGAAGTGDRVTWPIFQKTGREQAEKIIDSVNNSSSGNAYQWVIDRYGWMVPNRAPKGPEFTLCSLLDGLDSKLPGSSFGHVMDIPSFGKIIFGEVLVFPASVHLSMIRAELGSPTSAGMNISSAQANGGTIPPFSG